MNIFAFLIVFFLVFAHIYDHFMISGIFSWPRAFHVVEQSSLVIQCVISSAIAEAPLKSYLMLNSQRLPSRSEDYTVN